MEIGMGMRSKDAPLGSLAASREGAAEASGHALKRTRCHPTQPEATRPAGKMMKGVFLPSGLVLNHLEAQIPEGNCLFPTQVSPVQNTWDNIPG